MLMYRHENIYAGLNPQKFEICNRSHDVVPNKLPRDVSGTKVDLQT